PKSVCDWARLKFQIKIDQAQVVDRSPTQIKEMLHGKVMELYRQKETEFPVMLGMARFMSDKIVQGGHKYDREGLRRWGQQRFPNLHAVISEEDFRTLSRARLQEKLLEVSRQAYPTTAAEQIDARLAEAFSGTENAEAEDARELAEWARAEPKLDIPAEEL